jgi:hypothetical protein
MVKIIHCWNRVFAVTSHWAILYFLQGQAVIETEDQTPFCAQEDAACHCHATQETAPCMNDVPRNNGNSALGLLYRIRGCLKLVPQDVACQHHCVQLLYLAKY